MSIRAHAVLAIALVVLAVAKSAIFLFIVYLCFVDLGKPALTAADIDRTRWMLQLAGAVGVGTLLCTVGAALTVLKIRRIRLRELRNAVHEFERSDFRHGIPFSGSTLAAQDIDLLRGSFTHMTERIVGRIRQLHEAEDRLRTLVAEMSHDLKTPLALLQGYLETLLRKDATISREQQREYLRTASHHGHRLEKLVSELFELAELESPHASLDRQPFALNELAEDVCSSFQLRAQEKNVELRCDSEPDLPLVDADPRLIERVFENLIENAIRFSSVTGGSVVVDLRRLGDVVEVMVRDRGEGIGPDDLPLIFERSFRGRTRQKQDGSGLGLAIVRRILQLHGVSIEVESTVGEGTTFVFELPVARNS